MAVRKIRLTAWEIDQVKRALGFMSWIWTTWGGAHDRHSVVYAQDNLPTIRGRTLVLSPVDEINRDLYFRSVTLLLQCIEESTEIPETSRMFWSGLCHQLRMKLEQAGVCPKILEYASSLSDDDDL